MRLEMIPLAAALAACSTILPITGQMQGSSERFTGGARGNMSGSGALSIVTTSGVHCSGNFTYTSRLQASGTLTCEDGRSGPFVYYSTGTGRTGYGTLGNVRFTFTVGN